MPALTFKLRIVLFSTLGIVLTGLIVTGIAYTLLHRTPTPASFLPADRTVALFHGLTESDRQHFASRFPLFRDVPAFPSTSVDVAVVRLPSDALAWVSFIGTDSAIRTSSEEVLPLLRGEEGKLEDAELFRTLTPSGGPRWIYLDARLLLSPQSTDGDRKLISLLQNDPFILVQLQGTGATVTALLPSTLFPLQRRGFPTLPPPVSFSIALNNPQGLTEQLLTHLPSEPATILEGVTTPVAESFFGGDVSLRHDILPLFSEVSLSTGTRTETGASVRFLLEGEADTTKALSIIDRLHASAKRSLSTSVVQRRVLKEGFTSTIIADDPSVLHANEEVRDGWSVHSTVRGDSGEGFWTGVRGNRLLLSNDLEWFSAALSAPPTLPPNGASLSLRITRSLARFVLRDILSTPLADALLETFGPASEQLQLTVLQHGSFLSIVVDADGRKEK